MLTPGLIFLRSMGAYMERLRQLIHEIHRRSLWQVLGIYVMASGAVLGGVGTLSDVLRLPEWFSPLALAHQKSQISAGSPRKKLDH